MTPPPGPTRTSRWKNARVSTAATSHGYSARSCRGSTGTAAARWRWPPWAAAWVPSMRPTSRSSGPTSSRWRWASQATTSPRPGEAGASGAWPRTSTTRWTTSGTWRATTSTGCAAGSACCWYAARASGRTPPDRCQAPYSSLRRSPARASGTSSTCGASTCPTTGPPGAPSSHITCHDSAEWGPTLTTSRHLIGLLLGTEEDWPRAFEEILRRVGPVESTGGTRHAFDFERITIEPFSLRDRPRHNLVIDRLAYWYYVPREWLKKVSLMNGVYLLNSPFTFQSMEKHAAYCAMMRLGLKVPETVLVPYKNPVDNSRYAYTAARYNRSFDLDVIAQKIGYPLFMKPYDGGAWRGVSKINNVTELHAAYDASGEMLMHLQKAIDFDVFARSLSIGAETMVMKFQPDRPMHERYAVEHDFLAPDAGLEVVTIGRLVNAFFKWEFNSCETLVKGSDVYPIDYANACPDVALTSLHYYFPWAMKALVKWSVFALATGREAQLDLETDRYFAVADQPGLSYGEKLGEYRKLADAYFETERYQDFCATSLSGLDQLVLDWVAGPDFDQLLVRTVQAVYPAHEQEQFIAHLRGLLHLWVRDESARLEAA